MYSTKFPVGSKVFYKSTVCGTVNGVVVSEEDVVAYWSPEVLASPAKQVWARWDNREGVTWTPEEIVRTLRNIPAWF